MKQTKILETDVRLIIQASNISQGGGKSLLIALLNGLPSNVKVLALLDSRMQLPEVIPENLTIIVIQPTIIQRFRAQWWLFLNVKNADLILCFGNLPPLFKLKGKVSIFVQNRYLIEKNSLVGFSIKTKLRLIFERSRLRLSALNADEFIVQTPSMKSDLLSSGFIGKQPVYIRPFVSLSHEYQRAMSFKEFRKVVKKFDFIYVASGEPHKNHSNLIKAWCLLADQKIFPSLCLTLDIIAFADLCAQIDEKKLIYKLDVKNLGILPHKKIETLYSQSRALIFPSKFESFGLPLIEARLAGLPILASELDYVRDVLDPEQTFDPNSPFSITRAVKRFMGIEEKALPLLTASQFLDSIFKKEL